jgi:hypothetical protein
MPVGRGQRLVGETVCSAPPRTPAVPLPPVCASVWYVPAVTLLPLLTEAHTARAFLFGLAVRSVVCCYSQSGQIFLDFLGLQAEASKDLLDDIPGLALFSLFCVAGYLWVEMVRGSVSVALMCRLAGCCQWRWREARRNLCESNCFR